MLELTAETRQILSDRMDLLDMYRDNQECPTFANVNPAETEFYVGAGFLPTFLFEGDKLVEFNEPEEGPYVLAVIADDIPVSLTVGGQVLFDHSNAINLPNFSLEHYEHKLAETEAELDEWILRLAELNKAG
jgi:hypothetical protein